jgi:oligopeptide/dipeptide ABC transporter ATP-binding protein
MTALLEAHHLTKIFGGGLVSRSKTTALREFSMDIHTAQPNIIAVVGESGSGKTTMARLLLGIESPTEGNVLYLGKDLRKLNRGERLQFRRDVQVIFQDPFEVYNPLHKVDHVLETPIEKFHLASSNADKQALIQQSLQAVGLRPEETLGRYPHELSGGQRQRVMVARALLLKPKLIIADEPVSMIDASLRATVLDNLRKLNQDFGISIIYITHDLTTAFQISQNIIVLYRGSVAEAGHVEPIVQHPQHPYTQLLTSSIPLPDPKRTWSDEEPPSEVGRKMLAGVGCRFASRCPHAFEPCIQSAPPLFQTENNRAVACYLYQEHATLAAEKMDSVFVHG